MWIAVQNGLFERDERPRVAPESILLSFGWDRDSISRSYTVDITGGTIPADSPSDLSVRLASDLRRVDGTPGEFPSEQIVVGVNRLSETRISLAVTANPWAPERVADGHYEGTVEIRGPGIEEDVGVTAWLKSRDDRWAAVAGLLVFLGGALGLLVKYITERLTPQAALERRLATFKRAIQYGDDGASLPSIVRIRIEDLEDQIARSDYAAAERSFERFAQEKDLLAAISGNLSMLLEQVDAQRRIIDQERHLRRDVRTLLEGALEAEYQKIQDLRLRPWPEPNPKDEHAAQKGAAAELIAASSGLRSSFAVVYGLITRYLQNVSSPADGQEELQQVREELYLVQRGRMPDAERMASPGGNDNAGRVGAEVRYRDEPSWQARLVENLIPRGGGAPEASRLSFLFRQARTIAGVASLIVVALVGLKTQYLDQQNFDGSLSSWLTLVLWGATVELSGVAVLDVLGRLSSPTATQATVGGAAVRQ